jgi:hypothetical protein
VSLFGKLTNSPRCGFDVGIQIDTNEGKFISWQQEASRNIVAELFDLRVGEYPAHACRAKPKVSELVNQRERPGRSRILLVKHDERRDIIRQSETTKRFDVDSGVVTPKIAHQQNENTNRLDS